MIHLSSSCHPQHIEATAHNGLTLHFEGTQWENLNHVSIDTAGEHVYSLLPKVDGVLHRLMVEVKLSDNVKVVTFRSTFIVENLTSKEAEMVVLDKQGKAVSQILKIGECDIFDIPNSLADVVCSAGR